MCSSCYELTGNPCSTGSARGGNPGHGWQRTCLSSTLAFVYSSLTSFCRLKLFVLTCVVLIRLMSCFTAHVWTGGSSLDSRVIICSHFYIHCPRPHKAKIIHLYVKTLPHSVCLGASSGWPRGQAFSLGAVLNRSPLDLRDSSGFALAFLPLVWSYLLSSLSFCLLLPHVSPFLRKHIANLIVMSFSSYHA